ncbi:hypothetical protein [Nocardia sp. NPDC056000]
MTSRLADLTEPRHRSDATQLRRREGDENAVAIAVRARIWYT